MNVCVVGLGKIGLPLAVQVAHQGIRTIGADIDQTVVDLVNSGIPPFPAEVGLDQRLRSVTESSMLSASILVRESVAASDTVIVVVPLVIDAEGNPDYRSLDAATADVAHGLAEETLVIFETTTPVGTTRGRLIPALEKTSGLKVGYNFQVAFSPERVSSGTIFRDLARYPKLVGGFDDRSTAAAVSFYEKVLEFDDRPDLDRPNGVWPMGSLEAAEFTKLAETVYRDVNIALANELAAHAEGTGIDFEQVIAAANSQPFSHLHRPGIAVGGHCIPVYPHLYLSTDPGARLPSTAREVNRAQPRRLLERLRTRVGSFSQQRIVVLGSAYRGGVKESAFSGAFDLVALIRSMGGIPLVHDPLFSTGDLVRLGFDPYQLGQPCDYAIVQADHPEYQELVDSDLPGCKLILDGRAVIDPARWAGFGVEVLTVGRP